MLSAFGTRRGPARTAYRRFVSEGRGLPSPWHDLKQQIDLGDERFIKRMQAQLADAAPLDEIPATQRRAPPKSLATYARAHRDRDTAIVAAYLDGGHTMKAIGEHFGLHYSMVSRIVKAAVDGRAR
jgi:putative transposase